MTFGLLQFRKINAKGNNLNLNKDDMRGCREEHFEELSRNKEMGIQKMNVDDVKKGIQNDEEDNYVSEYLQDKVHRIWRLGLEADLEMNNSIRKSRIYEINYFKISNL